MELVINLNTKNKTQEENEMDRSNRTRFGRASNYKFESQ